MFLSSLLALNGCKLLSPSPAGGFAVSTAERTQFASGLLSPPRFIPGAFVSGVFTGTIGNETPYGTVQSYSGYEGYANSLGQDQGCNEPTDYQLSNNYYWVCYGEAPAYWTIDYQLNFYCGDKNLQYAYISNEPSNSYWTYQILNEEVALTSGAEGDCLTNDIPPASTRFAILGQLPQTLTLTGRAPFITTYGMPELFVYDGTATLVASETATSVSSDGTQATFPFPSSLQQNGYSVAVANQTSSAPGISAVGTNYLSIAQSTTIPGNPFGVSVGAQTDTYEYEDRCDRGDVGTSGSSYFTFPVVSLYSTNQVLIDGTPVSVGANPTAVAAYQSGSINVRSSDDCDRDSDVYSGTTRAVVANSGSNTISILDIVNDVALSTITVGNQPVALAVSSDGSTAYVANYTDGTVTQVNLTAGTVTATIAVGAQPTSVALTSAGTLWVGGAGFLTGINTQTMSVIATQPVTGKSIIALGYSDSVTQLVATTVDTSGNVYADEINPSTVQTGGVYAPVASNMVSSVGTYGTVRAYTATLASGRRGGGNLLNINQVGAPPLVIQDGWAVVTATPTGFTITDITGKIVLVSETTPSPVTAIAVDSSAMSHTL